MRPASCILLILCLAFVLLGSASTANAPAPARMCGRNVTITPVEDNAGFFWIQTPFARRLARYPDARAATPNYVIDALDQTWDADGNFLTEVDTLVVPTGSTVRWHLVTGIHTLTNGKDESDPLAGRSFDYLLDEGHRDFDSTFTAPDTLDYFCDFHLPSMVGTLIISNGITPTRLQTLGSLKRRFAK